MVKHQVTASPEALYRISHAAEGQGGLGAVLDFFDVSGKSGVGTPQFFGSFRRCHDAVRDDLLKPSRSEDLETAEGGSTGTADLSD
jgi:hypothetical protein